MDRGIGLSNGFPIRNRKYRGGSSQERAGRGINSTFFLKQKVVNTKS